VVAPPPPTPPTDWFGSALNAAAGAGANVQTFANDLTSRVASGGQDIMGHAINAVAQAGGDVQQFASTFTPPPPTPTPPVAATALSTSGSQAGTGDLQAYAQQMASKYGIDPRVFVAQIQQESGFNPSARSGAGAQGIAQFMPATAAGVGLDPSDPYASLEAAARMDAQNLQKYGGDWSKTLAAYNAGPGNVDKYGGVPPFQETQTYVRNILGAAKSTGQQALEGVGNAIGGAASALGTQARNAINTVSQFGDAQLSSDEAYSACGPAAAVRFAQMFGRNPTLREATDLAKTVGWTVAQGMAGLGSEKALMDKMGVPTTMVGPDIQRLAAEAQTGNPVTISTQGHYFTADGYDPNSGAFHVGRSGLDLKGGSEWMTPAQMSALMGPVQGGLLADNPQVPAPSTADQGSNPRGFLDRAKDAIGGAFSAVGTAVQQAVPSSLGTADHDVNRLDNAVQQASSLSAAADTMGIMEPVANPPTPSDSLTNPLGTGNLAPPPSPVDRLKSAFGDFIDQMQGQGQGGVMTAAQQPTPSDTLTNPTRSTVMPADRSLQPSTPGLTEGPIPPGIPIVSGAGNLAANAINTVGDAVKANIQNDPSLLAQVVRAVAGGESSTAIQRDLMAKYGTWIPDDRFTPEDRDRAGSLAMLVGGAEMGGAGDAVDALGNKIKPLEEQAAQLAGRTLEGGAGLLGLGQPAASPAAAASASATPSLEDFLRTAPRADDVVPTQTVDQLAQNLRTRTGPPGISIERGYMGIPGGPEVADTGTRYVVSRNAQGEPVGVLEMHIDQPSGQPGLLQVAVDPAYQRQGIGTALYKAAQDAGFDVEAASGAGGYTDAGARFAYARRYPSADSAQAAGVHPLTTVDPVAAQAAHPSNSAMPPESAVANQAVHQVGETSAAAGTPLDRINAMYAAPKGGDSIPQRLANARTAIVRALTDRGVDIAQAQQAYAKALGRPLNADEMMYELSRLQPGPAAETRLQQGLAPAIRSVGDDYQALRNYVTARSNIQVADGVGQDLVRNLADTQVPSNLTDKVNSAQTSLRGRQAALERLQADSLPDDARVAAAQRSVTSAQRTLTRAQSAVETARQAVLDSASRSGAEATANRMFSGGVNKADSEAAIQQIQQELGPERFARVQAAADQVSEYGRTLRQRLVDSGVLSADQADEMASKYPDWVKTRILQHMDDASGGGQASGTGIGLGSRDVHAYTQAGTVAAREDPLASMVAYTHQVEKMAMKNDTFNAAVKLDQASPSPQLRPVTGDFHPTSDQATVQGFINGQKQRFVTDNKALGQAIEGAHQTSLPKFMTAWANVFRNVAASRNPAFVAGHASFTIPQYIFRQTALEGGPQALPRVLSELVKGYGDVFQGMLQGKTLAEAGEGTQQLLLGGGGQFGALSGSSQDAARMVEQMRGIPINSAAGVRTLMKDLITLKPVENLVNRVDYGPRVAAMRLAEQRGMNPVQAIVAGRDATIDFNRGGTATRLLSQMIPFLNVGVQGPLQVARTFQSNPRAAIFTAGSLIGMPTVAAEIWNNADPQRAKDYADVPKYIKDQGIVIMLPTEAPVDARGDRHPQFAWINTRNWSPFVSMAREATDRAMGKDTGSWQDAAGSMLAGALPVQATGPADLAQKMALSLPGVQTAAQLALNKDFYRNRDIVTNRADVAASPTAKWLTPAAQGLADVVAPGSTARPSAIDFAIRNIGAGTATAGLSATDMALKSAGYGPAQKPNQAAAGPSTIPVLGSVVGRFVRGNTGESLQQARQAALTPSATQLLRDAGVQYTPTPVPSTVQGIPLQLDEETQLQETANRYVDDFIHRTAQTAGWQRATPAQRQTMIEQAVNLGHQRAEGEILRAIPAEERRARLAQALPQRGAASAAAQAWMNP
jgi:soluble lytic murein transglycosylase-like protein/GNAT superfamily N-acetyltransferase